MVLSPYRFNKRHAERQRQIATYAKSKDENPFEGVRIVARFGNPFTLRQENIERAAKDLADYLTDCAAGKQEYCADVEKRLRYVLHGFKTGQWVVAC